MWSDEAGLSSQNGARGRSARGHRRRCRLRDHARGWPGHSRPFDPVDSSTDFADLHRFLGILNLWKWIGNLWTIPFLPRHSAIRPFQRPSGILADKADQTTRVEFQLPAPSALQRIDSSARAGNRLARHGGGGRRSRAEFIRLTPGLRPSVRSRFAVYGCSPLVSTRWRRQTFLLNCPSLPAKRFASIGKRVPVNRRDSVMLAVLIKVFAVPLPVAHR